MVIDKVVVEKRVGKQIDLVRRLKLDKMYPTSEISSIFDFVDGVSMGNNGKYQKRYADLMQNLYIFFGDEYRLKYLGMIPKNGQRPW